MGEAPPPRPATDADRREGAGGAVGTLSARTAFALAAAAVLGLFLFVIVIQPAVERGGWGELVLVAAAFLVILGIERWLRSR